MRKDRLGDNEGDEKPDVGLLRDQSWCQRVDNVNASLVIRRCEDDRL